MHCLDATLNKLVLDFHGYALLFHVKMCYERMVIDEDGMEMVSREIHEENIYRNQSS